MQKRQMKSLNSVNPDVSIHMYIYVYIYIHIYTYIYNNNPSSRIWHLAVVTRLEREEDDSDYTKNVQRYWKGAVRDSRRRPCPTKPFQLALGQRGRYGPPLPIMSHTEKQIPAVPVGSADLNQGPTASPMGRGDVIQVLLPNMARTATHKARTNKDKVTELHLATYNVRTLSDECHLVSLENEIEKIKWDIIGISEMRRPGENVVELASQHIMFNKGNDKKQGGVGFLIHKKLKGNIEEFHATSNRVASVTIRISKRYKIRIIQVYAPTSVSSDEELEEFYDDLQTEMRHKKTHYNVIMGDFNAKVGKGDEDCVGSFGYGVRNDRGDDLINFATAHGFKIMNTYYKKKKNRRWTWRSPNFETFNEIDYVLVDKNNIVKNFEVLNKVNVDSDHRMIRCKVQIDSKQERKRLFHSKPEPLRVCKQIVNEFKIDLQNRYAALEEQQDDSNNSISLNDMINNITEPLIGAGKKWKSSTKRNSKFS